MVENVKQTVDSWSRYEFVPEAVVMELSTNQDLNCLFRDIFNSVEERGKGGVVVEMEE
jgi:hypothetical protein